ncbi:MAG: ATP phosphoribosyltransferase regulatory subunit, partial [Raoultibacter sp.]
QFYQADIDIIGDDSVNAEIELVCATSFFMKEIGINSRVRINDRRLLSALAATCRFDPIKHSTVFVTMDKLDKIGLEGVCAELLNKGHAEECVTKYRSILEGFDEAEDKLVYCESVLAADVKDDVLVNLRTIIAGVEIVSEGAVVPELDLSLVRGMGYYTGTIFEVESPEFKSSIAGGGRYDQMVGKFAGKDVPACGFSIGFERIIQILLEKKAVWESEDRLAILYDRDQTVEQVTAMQKECQRMREKGITVLLLKKARNRAHQEEQLSSNGYGSIIVANDDAWQIPSQLSKF